MIWKHHKPECLHNVDIFRFMELLSYLGLNCNNVELEYNHASFFTLRIGDILQVLLTAFLLFKKINKSVKNLLS